MDDKFMLLQALDCCQYRGFKVPKELFVRLFLKGVLKYKYKAGTFRETLKFKNVDLSSCM